MKSFVRATLAVAVLCSSLALAQQATIRTRDGRSLQGRVLTETNRGYLFATASGTELIEYSNIADFQSGAPAAVAPAPVAPMPSAPPAYQPPPPPPAPPADYAAPVAAPVAYQPRVTSEMAPPADRTGFHFGLGGGGFVIPTGYPVVTFGIDTHFDWTFGRTGFRLSPQVHMYSFARTYLVAGVHSQFQVNINDVYSFGIGLQLGAALGNDVQIFLAPSLAPLILKFGDRGQHQVQLNVSVPLIRIGSYYTTFGMPMTMLSYAYFF